MKLTSIHLRRALPAGLAALIGCSAVIVLLTKSRPPSVAPLFRHDPVGRVLDTLNNSEMRDDATTSLAGDGILRHLGAPAGTAFKVVAENSEPESIARRFLSDHAPAFGLGADAEGLTLVHARRAGPRTYVKLRQTHAGLPVYGGTVIIQLNEAGGVEYVGNYLAREMPQLPAPAAAKLSGSEAELAATQGGDGAVASRPELVWFAPSLFTLAGAPALAWRVPVRSLRSGGGNEDVFVGAVNGAILHRLSWTCTALNRTVFDANNNGSWPPALPAPLPVPGRVEGGPSSSVGDVNDTYNVLGDAYSFYRDKHGRNGIGGSDQPIVAVARVCDPDAPCPWANAQWSGLPDSPITGIRGVNINEGILLFGSGWAVDDVVAHEFTHGVTQFESGLHYENASGAINEAFSDIWGEFVDQTNARGNDTASVKWDVGEDLVNGRIRSMKDPLLLQDADRLGSTKFKAPAASPSGGTGGNDNGGVHSNSGIINKLCFLLADGQAFNGYSITGMGMDRVVRLFYEVNANLLGPSADYCDLSVALHQAASNLGWSASESDNLHRATLAVEIVGNYVDRSNTRSSPNGCLRPGVDTGGPFPQVTTAVSSLRGGDQMIVAANSYNERLRVTKPMRLTATGGTVTIGR